MLIFFVLLSLSLSILSYFGLNWFSIIFHLIDFFPPFVDLTWSRGHVVLVLVPVPVPENFWVEALLLDLDVALIVALMAIGPVIAKLETGRTSVIVVEKEVI
jgi:hypothetical protein